MQRIEMRVQIGCDTFPMLLIHFGPREEGLPATVPRQNRIVPMRLDFIPDEAVPRADHTPFTLLAGAVPYDVDPVQVIEARIVRVDLFKETPIIIRADHPFERQ